MATKRFETITFPLTTLYEATTALDELVSVGMSKRDQKFRPFIFDKIIDSKKPHLALAHLKTLESYFDHVEVIGVKRMKRLAEAIEESSTGQDAVWLLRYLPPEKFGSERIDLIKRAIRSPIKKWTEYYQWEEARLLPEERAILIESIKRNGTLKQAILMQSLRFGIMPAEQAEEVQELVTKLEQKTA
jgi:hypothetical protein